MLPHLLPTHVSSLTHSLSARVQLSALDRMLRKESKAGSRSLHIPLTSRRSMQVIADDRLGQRLLSTPMLATVLLHHPAKTGNLSAQPVPVGTAEVDLSGLLLPR